MCKTQYKSIYDRYKQSSKGLHFGAGVADNTATTKLLADKPIRQSLAFFVPKICEPTKPTFPKGAKRHIYKRAFRANTSQRNVTSYGGLIRPNTIASMVNKSSRLVTVVETRHPFILGGFKTTKLLGGH